MPRLRNASRPMLRWIDTLFPRRLLFQEDRRLLHLFVGRVLSSTGFAIVLPFLPGSRDPRAELEHAKPYSIADRFIPIPMYGVTIAIFLGIVVLWQMRKEPRPLPDALVAQRVQAYVGIALALLATVILYAYVALHGPR